MADFKTNNEFSFTNMSEFARRWVNIVYDLQNTICTQLEAIDGKAKFIMDDW